MLSKPGKNPLLVVAVLVALGVLVPFMGPFVILLVTQALIFGILAMSVDLLLGYTGLATMGQAAFLGIGAYTTAILATRFGFGLGCDYGWAILLGMLAGALVAAVFGLFAVRATGVYFLIITLALGMCVWGLAIRWNAVTGGDNGINLLSRPVCGVALSKDINFFYLALGLMSATMGALWVLVRSPFGRSLLGIRESETRMKMLGYNTWLHKYIAYILSGACGGMAGVLWAHLHGIVAPETVILTTSVDALLMVVLGGPGTLVGGPIGTAVVVFLREFLSTKVTWWQYVLGGVYVMTILFLPDGLMGIPARLRQRRSKGGNGAGGAGRAEKPAALASRV